jgi:hypothetical protein
LETASVRGVGRTPDQPKGGRTLVGHLDSDTPGDAYAHLKVRARMDDGVRGELGHQQTGLAKQTGIFDVGRDEAAGRGN